MSDVMLDLETMGTSPGSAILAIGAVRFGNGKIIDEFYYRPTWGGRIEASTVRWWMRQSDTARAELIKEPDGGIEAGLVSFMKFLGKDDVWGNGSDFDNAILADCYRRFGVPCWSHRQNSCYRTMKKLVNIPFVRPTAAHNAVEDARAQAVHLMAIFEKLGIK